MKKILRKLIDSNERLYFVEYDLVDELLGIMSELSDLMRDLESMSVAERFRYLKLVERNQRLLNKYKRRRLTRLVMSFNMKELYDKLED